MNRRANCLYAEKEVSEMKSSRLSTTFYAALATLMLVAPLRAAEDHDHDHGAHEHHSPKYGGIVEEANGLDHELVLKSDQARLYVDGHDEKVSVKGGKATVTFLKGGTTTKYVLLPSGDNWFEVKGVVPTGPGTRAVAVILLKGKATSVRFAVK